jgi:hypothetical protein
MSAIVHFSSALAAGSLVVGKTTVNTQVTGLVDVSVDYLCRSADLPTHVAKFYIDAPPPVFPSKTIARSTLSQGRLHMVNYGVSDEYGIATISARYAGVTSQPIKPFKSFEYSDFATGARVYVSLTGFFGGPYEVGAFNEADNDFAYNHALTVGMRGRTEGFKYTWASLDTGTLPETLPPKPSTDDAFDELELIPGALTYNTDLSGRFGDRFAQAVWTEISQGQLEQSYAPAPATAFDVLTYAAEKSGLVGTVPTVFAVLSVDDWRSRGVQPQVFFNTSRRTEAVTPSVYIREIEYRPFTR